MTHRFIKKTFAAFFIVLLSFSSPLMALAVDTVDAPDGSGGQVYVGKVVDQNSQAATYKNGVDSGQSVDVGAGATEAIGSAIGCSAGQILANLIVSGISTVISKVTDKVSEKVDPDAATSVPTNEKGPLLNNVRVQTNAEQGTVTFGGLLAASSWNSVAWCLINAVIEYIANATIAWANSGFNGNPAFVDNPEQFFTDLADQEAASFIQELVGETTGINVCEPFKVQIGVNLSRAYGSRTQRPACTLQGIEGNFNNFVNGSFNQGGWGGWFNVTQNDQNNPYGAYIMNNDLLYAKINSQQNTAQLELGWNKGFLSFQTCDDPNDKTTCHTVTPGTLVASGLEKTLGLPKDRLVLAQKFDQVISAIINNLIKVALNEVLTEKSSKNNGNNEAKKDEKKNNDEDNQDENNN